MKKAMGLKQHIVLLLTALSLILLCACSSSSSLSGTYVSESGTYSIEFDQDGECTWYQDTSFFNGTYAHNSDGDWKLEIEGDSIFFSNTVFIAVRDGSDLIITGGAVDGERFVLENEE